MALGILEWSVDLNFGRPETFTLGTVLRWLFSLAIPPLAIFVGVIGIVVWIISTAGQGDHKIGRCWPDWWGRLRYKIHVGLRRCWYLGHPPKESWLSDWPSLPARWKQ